MKQIIVYCLTLTTVLGGNLNHIYAPLYLHGLPNLIDLGEHLDLSHTHLDHEYPAGILLGYGYISGLDGQHHVEQNFYGAQHAINPVSASLAHSFEKNLISPELPKLQPQITTSITTSYQPQSTPNFQFSSNQQISTPTTSQKFTSTPIQTSEIREDKFEPKPIPLLSQLPPPSPPTVVDRIRTGPLVGVKGNGNYALGSESLSYGSSSVTGQNTPQLSSPGTALNYGGISSLGGLSGVEQLNYGSASLRYGAGSGLLGGSSLGLHFGSIGYGGGGIQGLNNLGSSGSSALSSLGTSILESTYGTSSLSSSGSSSLGSSSGFNSLGFSGSSGYGQSGSVFQGSGGVLKLQ